MSALMTAMPTPVGKLTLVAENDALIACWMGDPSGLIDRLALSEAPEQRADLGELSAAVAAYFDGDLKAIDGLPVQQPGPAFRQACWDAMRAVPPGETISYKELATRAGQPDGARAAGGACARNLVALIVPCHRIVTTSGALGGLRLRSRCEDMAVTPRRRTDFVVIPQIRLGHVRGCIAGSASRGDGAA